MRTMLFVPGDKEKLLLKSLGLGTDAVIWDSEVAYAEKVVLAFRQAQEENRGVITVDGKMIDGPIVERAKLILRLKGEN